jgi:hypothetical protein
MIKTNLMDISFTSRDLKGFNFESRVDTVLNDIGVSYLSNPLDNIKEWKSRQGKGSDFKIPLWNWELEAKYSEGKIFPSWIERDYIPRFRVGSFRVTVYNETMKWTTSSLEKCFIHDIYLVEISYLKYVLKAEMKHRLEANKVLEPNSSKNSDSKNSNILDSKNENSKIRAKNIETENRRAITEEKTESSTFKEISYSSEEISYLEKEFSPSKRLKIVCMNLFLQIKRLVLGLWYNRSGSVTLVNWIPIKLRTKNKNGRKRSQKMFSCPFRVVVVCSHYPQFYLCSLLVVYDCIQKLLRLGYDEDKIYHYIQYCLLKGMWQYKNTLLIRCRCKPISFIDNEIVDRRFRTTLSIFEPCKKYKCSTMIGRRICPYLLAIKKIRVKAKQLNLSTFMEGMMDGQEKRSSL